MSVEVAVKVAVGIVSLALTAVGTVVGIELIPNSGPAALKPLAVSVIALALLGGCFVVARALVWKYVQRQIQNARQREEEKLRSYQRTLGQLVSRWPTPSVSQTIQFRVTVGLNDEGDRTHEEYTFTPTSPQGVLFWSVDYASQTAAAAAPDHRLTPDHVGLAIAVDRIEAEGQILHTVLQTEDPGDERRLDALVILQPAVQEGETVRLTADYQAPGTWSKLRSRGADYFALRVPDGGSTKELSVTFVLPPKASGVSWTLTEAPSGARQCSPVGYPARPGDLIELHWTSGPDPKPGRYRLDIRLNPLA